MNDILLRIENGCFAYRGGPQILEDINAELRAGEILAVLGPNGAGKTTLLRCMMDMLHWKSGRSLLGGEDIRSIPAARLWRRMAYVPQAKAAAASYTAFQTVLLGRSSRIGAFSSPSDKDMEAAERVMRELGIEDLMDKPCHAISGGELQMVLIARAMAAEPEILVLDEPESNLDFKNQLIVLDAMSDLAARGVACIFNTHYPAHALQRADKSLILSRNRGTGAEECAGRDAAGGEAYQGSQSPAAGCIYGSTSRVVTEDNIRKAFGVNAVIGEVETDENVLKSVMPLSIDGSGGGRVTAGAADGPAGAQNKASQAAGQLMSARSDGPDNGGAGSDRIASVTVILEGNSDAGRVNALLAEYSRLVIGRMGQPHRSKGLYIINVNLDGPAYEIEELSHRLSILPGICVKTTYAQLGKGISR